jgi:hypothetical protein
VKVYILAGQSNMQGHGVVKADPARNGGMGTLEYAAKDPATSAKFGQLLDSRGEWKVRDDVWIHYMDRKGRLSVNFGVHEGRIGPELGFGNVIGNSTKEPVLLIKLAWGGKSLRKDFRPPSAGGETGPFYTEVVERAKAVLANVGREFPELAGRRVELSGFGWHQGWNDRIDPVAVAEYQSNMAHFIRDIRRDLGVKDLPFVIAETGMGGLNEKNPRALQLMQAQAAVAEQEEFRGNVAFAGTRAFWRENSVSPSQQDYHWNGNAETYYLIGEAMGEAMRRLTANRRPPSGQPVPAEMAGYLLVPHSRVDRQYNAGFSMYVAAWPLLKQYPGNRFQSGLPGTWMFAQNDPKPMGQVYSDIEGGLGWWRDTRFATVTPKFIMGGVALNFSEWANGPGAGKGRNWENPTGLYGAAQLSPWVLWPPDGLNLKQGTSGELLGYGYLPLPLTSAKPATRGAAVPTGDQSWTLFLNAGNFKGPVAFFTPYFFSKPTVQRPDLAGKFLDARPSEPNKAVQMETQYIPARISADSQGRIFARTAPVTFPRNAGGDAPLIHRITAYTRAALWDDVLRWFEGKGPAPKGIRAEASAVHRFSGGGGSTWRIYPDGAEREDRASINWAEVAEPVALDEFTYGYRWKADRTTASSTLTTLPEYYMLGRDRNNREQWQAVHPADVPAETKLAEASLLPAAPMRNPEPYVTPDGERTSWKTPGPKAGPFTAVLGDGSVVTYYWYRFADQPALLNADLTPAEREEMQRRVEMIHRSWKKDRQFLPPNTVGRLADLDPALLVKPPKGLEVGYVPIVTRQAAR